LSVIDDTLPLALIATVPVPLKLTQALELYDGALPDAVVKLATPFQVLSPRKKVVLLGLPVALSCDIPTVPALGTPTIEGRPRNKTAMLFVPDGGAPVNVRVFPETE
jgi:hypothetical protein